MNKRSYIFIIAIIIILLLSFLGLFEAVNERIYDNYILFHREKTISPDIVIVEIDDKSLSEMGEWPWQRTYHAELLKKIINANPAVIGITLEFINPQNPESDSKLFAVLKSFPNIVLSASFKKQKYNNNTFLLREKNIFPGILQGHTYIKYSENSIVRSFSLFKHYPAFALEIVKLYSSAHSTKTKRVALKLESLVNKLKNNNFQQKNEILIDYKRTPDKYKHFSFLDIVNDKVDLRELEGKIVLIGITEKNLTSNYATPFSSVISPTSSSIELQAQIIDSLINYKGLNKPPELFTYVLSLVIALLFYYLIRKRRVLIQGIALIVVLITICLLDYFLFFDSLSIWFPPALMLILILILSGLTIFFTTIKLDQSMEKTINKYEDFAMLKQSDAPSALDSKFDSLTEFFETVHQDRQTIKTIIEGVNNGIILMNNIGIVIWANGKIMDMFKNSLVVNQKVEELIEGICFQEILDNTANNNVYKKELSINGQDFLVVFNPVIASESKIVAIFNDITYLKELDRFKSDMFRLAHHELINPLMVVQIAAENIQCANNTDKIKENTETIFESSELMLNTINNFLSISRIEGGKIHTNLVKSNIISLINNCIHLNNLAAKRKTIQLVFEHSGCDEIHILVDENLLYIAINNLLSNAIKYSPDNSVITIKLEINNSMLVISIMDSGIGIPENDIDRVFDKFFRSTNNANKAIRGTGLGLFIVKMVAQLHNGDVSVKSVHGEGSCFAISIPM